MLHKLMLSITCIIYFYAIQILLFLTRFSVHQLYHYHIGFVRFEQNHSIINQHWKWLDCFINRFESVYFFKYIFIGNRYFNITYETIWTILWWLPQWFVETFMLWRHIFFRHVLINMYTLLVQFYWIIFLALNHTWL
jgi:hypothetical protein